MLRRKFILLIYNTMNIDKIFKEIMNLPMYWKILTVLNNKTHIFYTFEINTIDFERVVIIKGTKSSDRSYITYNEDVQYSNLERELNILFN